MASLLQRLFLLQVIGYALGRHMSIPTLTTRLQQDQYLSLLQATTTPLALLPREEPPLLLTNSVTCGYTSGLWYSAVTCAPDYTCNYYTTPYSAPNFGCCSSGNGCGYVSACIDYNARGNPNKGGGVVLAGDDFLCGSDFPYCSTVLLYGQEYTSKGTYSFLSYGCQTGKGTTITAYQHTTQDTTQDTLKSTSKESAMSPSSSTSTTASSHSIAETISATSSLAAASTTIASAPQGLSEGAQIGIGVGVGIFAAVALVAALLCLRHRSKTRSCVQMDAKPHLHSTDYHDGAAAGYGNRSLVDYKASLQEQGYNNNHSRAELATSPRCYELGGNHP